MDFLAGGGSSFIKRYGYVHLHLGGEPRRWVHEGVHVAGGPANLPPPAVRTFGLVVPVVAHVVEVDARRGLFRDVGGEPQLLEG